ncbi:hypothetical protein [Burkholderia sp. WSM2230]|uniref:hypothetical protein n=1 Tax=Burkholderia sp. WSM2230 TaxID=944435 RepID=UPI001E56C355|nr:hypothetical protein [Burkholderia sp. WSM2230]
MRLTNGMFGTLLTPESTLTRTALAASACGVGVVFVTLGPADELVDAFEAVVPPEPPPPPPQALTSNAKSKAHDIETSMEV